MPYRTIFILLTIGLGIAMLALAHNHGHVPRWQGLMAMGAALMAVSAVGLAQNARQTPKD